jgi:hypothetical protein
VTQLEQVISVDGREQIVESLVRHYVDHMYWSIRDLVRSKKRLPSEERLRHSASLLQTASPAQVGLTAAWLDVLEVLKRAGLTTFERFEVLVEVLRGDFAGGVVPGPGLVAHAVSGLSADEVRPVVESLDESPVRSNPLYAVMCALPMIRAGEPPPESIYRASLFRAPPDVVREVLLALEPDRREQVLLGDMKTNSSNMARVVLEALSFQLDLIDTQKLKEAMARLRKTSLGYPDIEDLHSILDAGGPTLDEDELSPFVRESVDWWLQMQADARRAAGVGAMAEHGARQRLDIAGAVELENLEAWASASDERRELIARSVLEAIGSKTFKFTGLETYSDLPIAVYVHRRKKVKLSLIPGGTFARGLSEAEERKIREQASAAGIADTPEEFGQFIDQIPHMRPVRKVRVGPMLVGQGPEMELDPSELDDWLERGPWRLPTEAEWEYVARAGQDGQLTFRGDDLPLEAWFLDTCDLGEKAANRFGLWGFGLKPEVCADRFVPSYEATPLDGSPVCGKGPRVARGGAAEIYPWQGCGEWHLLLTAMRTSQQGWEHTLVARPVIGLRPLPRRPWVTPNLTPFPCA